LWATSAGCGGGFLGFWEMISKGFLGEKGDRARGTGGDWSAKRVGVQKGWVLVYRGEN
jgi:hypothetical protein